MSAGERLLNRLISSVRVVIEHVIAGVKRCRIVKDVLRLTKEGGSDLVMEIACGLHQHSRIRFAALTAGVGRMRTVIDGIQVSIRALQFLMQNTMDFG